MRIPPDEAQFQEKTLKKYGKIFLMLFAFFVATADLIPTPAEAQVVIVTHPHHRHHRHYRHRRYHRR